jgi:hypothetical protein
MSSAAELASTLVVMKEFTEAESLTLRVLGVRRRLRGEKHTLTLNSLSTLGLIKRGTSQSHEALSIFKSVLAGRNEVLGPGHPSTKEMAAEIASLQNELELETQLSRSGEEA